MSRAGAFPHVSNYVFVMSVQILKWFSVVAVFNVCYCCNRIRLALDGRASLPSCSRGYTLSAIGTSTIRGGLGTNTSVKVPTKYFLK